MFKKDNFVKYTALMTKKGNETFIAMLLFWIGKPNIAQTSLPQ